MKTCMHCIKKHYARGLCMNHYKQSRKYGDPLFRIKSTHKGETLRWLQSHVEYCAEECLIWPFGRTSEGYGSFGRSKKAHRVMCELSHGAPASTDLQAAHSCGNGHLGCVAPLHLRWATAKENTEDSIRHGTLPIGSKRLNAKLTEETVRKARFLYMSKNYRQKDLAEMFGCSISAMGYALVGRTWRHVA